MHEEITRDPSLDPISFAKFRKEFIDLFSQQLANKGHMITGMEDEIMLADIMCATTPEEKRDFMMILVGSFLGESLNKIWGSSWHYSSGQERWVLLAKSAKGDNVEMNVFRKVKNRMVNGEEDSIEYWFENAKKILSGYIPGQS